MTEIEELRTLQKEYKQRKEAFKKTLPQRKIDILNLRLKDKWTLQAIGDKYGLTRERVRQIVTKPL